MGDLIVYNSRSTNLQKEHSSELSRDLLIGQKYSATIQIVSVVIIYRFGSRH